MQTRSPLFTPLFFSICATWQTLLCNRLYVTILVLSSGLLGSQIIAGSSPFVSKWRSIQFSVMFSFAPLNHSIFGSVKFQSNTLSHFFFHKKFSATSAQNFSGASTLSLYFSWYSSNDFI